MSINKIIIFYNIFKNFIFFFKAGFIISFIINYPIY